MKAVILHYAIEQICSIKLPQNVEQVEDIERFLEDDCGFRISDISYMVVNSDDVEVYDGTTGETIAII